MPMLSRKGLSSTPLLLISSPSRTTHPTKATALLPLTSDRLTRGRASKGTRVATRGIRRLNLSKPRRTREGSHQEMTTSRARHPTRRVPLCRPPMRAPAAQASERGRLLEGSILRAVMRRAQVWRLLTTAATSSITTTTANLSSNSSTPCIRSLLRPPTSKR